MILFSPTSPVAAILPLSTVRRDYLTYRHSDVVIFLFTVSDTAIFSLTGTKARFICIFSASLREGGGPRQRWKEQASYKITTTKIPLVGASTARPQPLSPCRGDHWSSAKRYFLVGATIGRPLLRIMNKRLDVNFNIAIIFVQCWRRFAPEESSNKC